MSATQKRGWIIGGGGVGMLLVGVGTGLWASSYEDEVEQIYNTGRPFPDGKDTHAKIINGLTIGLTSIGSAALITGAVLIWRGREAESALLPSISLAPYANGARSVGLSASASF